jgi:hypothetical protein
MLKLPYAVSCFQNTIETNILWWPWDCLSVPMETNQSLATPSTLRELLSFFPAQAVEVPGGIGSEYSESLNDQARVLKIDSTDQETAGREIRVRNGKMVSTMGCTKFALPLLGEDGSQLLLAIGPIGHEESRLPRLACGKIISNVNG